MEFKTSDLQIADVLDKYYSWLVSLMGPAGSDKVALFGTITTLDVIKKSPMYTNGVFRSFSDRTITVSPENFGAGNTSDRYSRRYKDLINLAGYKLINSTALTDKQILNISKAEEKISGAANEISTIRSNYSKNWATYAKELGLKPNTPEYNLERANYYAPSYPLIRIQRDKIAEGEAARKAARMASYGNDPDGAQLCEIFERCNSHASLQNLPSTSDVEQIYNLDPIKIGEAAQLGLFPFEEELGIEPSQSLTAILDSTGVRECSISSFSKVTHKHDRAWGGRVGGSWLSVFGGGFNAGGGGGSDEHVRKSLTNIEEIKITCDFLTDCWVRRRGWFDATIFSNKYVKSELKKHPEKAAQLALCISSAIVVRGLKITYKFKSVDDTEIWSSWNSRGGGGFNVFGFSFGGAASSGGSDYSHEVDKEKRTVTFKDGDKTCRLLALRVSQLIPNITQKAIAFAGLPLSESEYGSKLIKSWEDGTVKYGTPLDELIQNFTFEE